MVRGQLLCALVVRVIVDTCGSGLRGEGRGERVRLIRTLSLFHVCWEKRSDCSPQVGHRPAVQAAVPVRAS